VFLEDSMICERVHMPLNVCAHMHVCVCVHTHLCA
jgi:hypothetical protein